MIAASLELSSLAASDVVAHGEPFAILEDGTEGRAILEAGEPAGVNTMAAAGGLSGAGEVLI